jgi:hypothetical protein
MRKSVVTARIYREREREREEKRAREREENIIIIFLFFHSLARSLACAHRAIALKYSCRRSERPNVIFQPNSP